MRSARARSSPQSFVGAVIVLLLVSCDWESPTAPTPPTATPSGAAGMGFVGGYVYTPSGACLPGAVVEILDGVRAGATSIHIDHCQGPWDYENRLGYSFKDLPVGLVRMRASKEGYHSQEMTFTATSGAFVRSDFKLAPK